MVIEIKTVHVANGQIHILFAENGKYDEWEKWPVRAYASHDAAQKIADQLNALLKQMNDTAPVDPYDLPRHPEPDKIGGIVYHAWLSASSGMIEANGGCRVHVPTAEFSVQSVDMAP